MRRTLGLLILNCFLFLSASAQQPQPTEIKIDPNAFDEFVGQYAFADNPDVILSFFRESTRSAITGLWSDPSPPPVQQERTRQSGLTMMWSIRR